MREGGMSRAVAIAVALVAVGATVAWLLMSEVPRGGLHGVVLAEELGTPIPDARVMLSSRAPAGADLLTRTDAAGRFRFDAIPAGPYRMLCAAQAHAMGTPREVAVTEGRTQRLVVELPPVEPFMGLSLPTEVFTPAEQAQIRARGFTTLGALDLAIYRLAPEVVPAGRMIDPPSMLRRRPGADERLDLAGSQRLSPVSRRPLAITGRDAEGVFTMRLDVPRLRPGVYVVAVENEELQRIVALTVTDLALVCKLAPDKLLAWAVDITSGKPRSGVQVSATLEERPALSAVTGADGLAVLPLAGAGGHGEVLVTARSDDAVATVQCWLYGPGEGEGHRVCCYTDRPAYRPGDEVRYKGIVRAAAGESWAVPTGFPVQVQVRDDMDNLVHAANLRTSEFGSFDGALRLPEAALPGVYALKTSIAGEPHYADFIVAEYRKPEWEVTVTTPRERYVRGETMQVTAEATYFYGAPVADARVEYTVTRAEQYSWPEQWEWEGEEWYYQEYDGGCEVVASGAGITDSAGRFVFAVPTVMPAEDGEEGWRLPADYSYRVAVEVTDKSRRSVSASHSVTVVQGEFRLELQAEPSILQVGEQVQVTIRAADHDGRPVQAHGRMRLELAEWVGNEERFETRSSSTFATDASGTAKTTVTPAQEGSHRLLVTAQDARGNTVAVGEWLWVTRDEQFSYAYPYGELDLVADRRGYREGDVARILVNTELAPATALLTIESETIRSHRIIELPANSTMVEVKLEPQWAPNCWIGVSFVRDKRFMSDELPVRIAPQSRTLQVAVSSDRAQYGPGEQAVYTVRATGPDGRPARAEVSLAVVDEALHSIYPYAGPAILNVFYPRRGHYVQTQFSFPMVYLDGGEKGPGTQIPTRQRFLDTAFWAPSAVTNDAGEANFRFTMPDNLTTWRATARAHTMQTVVGEATHKAVCTRPFLVRLAAPRFITQDDRLRLGAIVHNRTAQALQAQVGLEADGLQVAGGAQSGQVAAGQACSFEWEVSAPAVGEQTVRVWARSGSHQDAMQVALPVHPRGRHRVEQRTGVVASQAVEVLAVRRDAIPGASEMIIRVTPSLAGAMLGSLDYLATYPYGCIEQTTSAFLPDVIIARMLDELGLEQPGLRQRLPKLVQNGLLRVYGYQRDDGGWGWWGYDSSDPWMTAYVVFALDQAREAGFEVNGRVLSAGAQRLAELYRRTDLGARSRAWMAYALTRVGRGEVVRAGRAGKGIEELVAHTSGAGVDARALTCLTLYELGEAARAREMLGGIWRDAKVSEEIIHWEAAGDDYWYSLDTEVTALALSAASRLMPEDPRLAQVVRWLLLARQGNHWHATRDTAFALYALADYLPATGEAAPDCTATVTVNGRQLLSQQFTRADIVKPEVLVAVPGELLTPGAELRATIDRQGRGRLYYALELDQHVRGDLTVPPVTGTGVSIERSYRAVAVRAQPGQALRREATGEAMRAFRSGDVIEVTLRVTSQRAHEYMVLEDRIPAGCEIIDRGPVPIWEWAWWWSDQIVRDELMAFALRELPAGTRVLSYRMKAQVPGRYCALPTVAYNMYDPRVRATGASDEITIAP
ncbi:MAG: alpha-2-macroglobulin [Armatimonadota bacterium]